MADGYLRNRQLYHSVSGTVSLAAADGDTTLVTNPSADHTIYIQRLRCYILTDAAQSISFEDSNSSAKVIARVPVSPGADMAFEWDFGPDGIPLTVGKNFVCNVSAAGLAANIGWDGYRKLTAANTHA